MNCEHVPALEALADALRAIYRTRARTAAAARNHVADTIDAVGEKADIFAPYILGTPLSWLATAAFGLDAAGDPAGIVDGIVDLGPDAARFLDWPPVTHSTNIVEAGTPPDVLADPVIARQLGELVAATVTSLMHPIHSYEDMAGEAEQLAWLSRWAMTVAPFADDARREADILLRSLDMARAILNAPTFTARRAATDLAATQIEQDVQAVTGGPAGFNIEAHRSALLASNATLVGAFLTSHHIGHVDAVGESGRPGVADSALTIANAFAARPVTQNDVDQSPAEFKNHPVSLALGYCDRDETATAVVAELWNVMANCQQAINAVELDD